MVRNRVRRQLRHAAVQLEQAGVFQPAPYLVIVHPLAVDCSMTELGFHLKSATSKQPNLQQTKNSAVKIVRSDKRAINDRFER